MLFYQLTTSFNGETNMTTTTQATKCIAVSTPFGTMYLTKHSDFDTYHNVGGDVKTQYAMDKLCTCGLHIVNDNNGWVAVYNAKTADLVSYLPIASNYGDQFPQ